MISKDLRNEEAKKLDIHSRMKLSRIEDLHKEYLDYHRKNVFR